jgi:hypothetical protein
MKKLLTSLVVLLLGAPAAQAANHAALNAEIATQRTRTPQVFEQMGQLKNDVLKNGVPYARRAHLARALKAFGKGGLYPLLDLITAPDVLAAPPATRDPLLVAGLEAIGKLRDRRALPVVRGLFEAGETSPGVARAAAQAIGQLGGTDDAAYLAARALPGDSREDAALYGLGYCRLTPAAQHLEARLAARPPTETVRTIADAMAQLGSSWAWEALGPSRAAEGDALRAGLAATLVAALPHYQGPARDAIEDALLVVAHPSTPNRLAALRKHADPSLAAALQALEHRWLR